MRIASVAGAALRPGRPAQARKARFFPDKPHIRGGPEYKPS
ncbi:MAG: hypothetical protein QOJ52_366 [Acidimicrobiaceae bacterium]|nr:hypothetical protein [Acidimicrobiaceae bacterium]